ncbi:VOC family protein [Candidatus Ulvibacter alkanivorans]|uniref:VOC family protein n=1 Tax=Candidatus Ulvibacter alkanivorans TaxID=2267620 RepID=UPI000DF3ED46|nr:VOC family protein [Candidatus Ulvibacter alkanivorans]
MSSPNEQFSHATTILLVSNMNTSLEFYTKQLEFKCTFSWMDPITYAVLKRDGVSIHLSLSETTIKKLQVHPAISIFVHDVDAVYNAFRTKNVEIYTPIGDRAYKMRDFDVLDPDGYMLTFGKGIN